MRRRDAAWSGTIALAAPLYIGCYSVWDSSADDEANERWHHETLRSLEPITRGHYMGETDLLASPTRASESLAPGVWERLQEIRHRYDPHGIFYGGGYPGKNAKTLPESILKNIER
jgi:FAD/FMN-containing dehydrogenase